MCTTMSEQQGQDAAIVAPTLLVTIPAEERANTTTKSTLAGRRRSKTESSALNEPGRGSANEWIDIDNNESVRRRRSSKRRTTTSPGNQKSRNTDFDIGRFLPRLGRILESTDGSASRPHKKTGDPRKRSEKHTTKIPRSSKDDLSGAYRRPAKHRVGGLSRQNPTTLRINPSLLSVISGLTGISDSSSNTTITQQSYNNQSYDNPKLSTAHRRTESAPIASSSRLPSVFEYMDSDGEGSDGSESSSRSSHYSASDDGSSEAAQTPSSNSTCPSPTATKSRSLAGSVTGVRPKQDVRSAVLIDSPSNSRCGSEAGSESVQNHERRDSATYSQADYSGGSVHSSGSRDGRYPRTAQSEKTRHLQLDPRQPRLSHPPHHVPHLVEPIYGQTRSHSTSSAGSTGSQSAYAQYMSMQQYQHPSAPIQASYFTPQQGPTNFVAHPDRPPVPDAPDLNQKTIVGYELLAQELASADSPVSPVYRKFEYLNHRILLHLQDELCEMEEQLRTTDEIIAQMETPVEEGRRSPASRRGDSFHGSEMHHRRTALLGRIFLKTEQYNRALSSFAQLAKDSSPVEAEQLATYRDWMAEKSPIHDMEAKFLQKEQDLVQPGATRSSQPTQDFAVSHPSSKNTAVLSCLPVALMLPLLLYSIIPTLAGRLVVTLLIGIAVFLVAATTRIRHMLPLNEWAVCGGAYVLIMAAIAGCIPQHAV